MASFTKQPIIVPWDFSDMSRNALDRALELADSNDKVEVVHVTPYPAVMEPSVVWGAYSEDVISQNLAEAFHEAVPESDYPGIKFRAVFGDPGSQIAKLAKDVDAGLIVISSHGRTGITRLVLGSVAERVVRLAPCEVLVLRADVEVEG